MSCCNCSPAAILVDSAGDPLGVPGNPVNVTGVAIPQPVDVVIVGGGLNFDPNMADAFGRLRVSNPETLFDSKQVFDNNGLNFWEVATGAASFTYTQARASTYLNVTAANGDSAVRQTKRYFNYSPGKSQLIFQTYVLGVAAATLRRRVGYFSVNDGIFLEQNGTTDVRLVQRSSVSGAPSDAVFETQNTWNLDPLNGLGPSGETLDLSKAQVMVIDFEWLGAGLVRVGFVMPNDSIVYAHVFKNPNMLTSVYMSTPNLPVRYEITRIAPGPGGTDTLEAICCTVISEGGQEPVGAVWSADRSITTKTAPVGSLIPLFAIRWKTGFFTRTMNLLSMQVHDTTANGTVLYRLLKNPTRGAGAAPVWVSAGPESGMEYDITSAQVITAGRELLAGYAQGRTAEDLQSLPEQITLNPLDYAATASDEFVLCAQTASGGGGDACLAAMTWVEL